jgi:hypothetical protein
LLNRQVLNTKLQQVSLEKIRSLLSLSLSAKNAHQLSKATSKLLAAHQNFWIIFKLISKSNPSGASQIEAEIAYLFSKLGELFLSLVGASPPNDLVILIDDILKKLESLSAKLEMPQLKERVIKLSRILSSLDLVSACNAANKLNEEQSQLIKVGGKVFVNNVPAEGFKLCCSVFGFSITNQFGEYFFMIPRKYGYFIHVEYDSNQYTCKPRLYCGSALEETLKLNFALTSI